MLPGNALQSILSITAATPNLTHLFGPSLSPEARIYWASDPDYAQRVTQRWTNHEAPSFFGTIKPAIVGDIQEIVKIASSNQIPFLATGGGHSTSIYVGRLHDGVQVDMSNFDSVNLQSRKNLLTVGGAARFSQITDLLYDAGKEFPIGTAPCVGMVGATLGAGVSSLQGDQGLLIDVLESVQLVTANGSLVTASATENADLFWGIKGAGTNFGIVTSATYKVSNLINDGQVLNANFMYPISANRSIWEILQDFDETLPSRLAINIAVLPKPETKEFRFIVNANYFGTVEDGLSYLKSFIDLGPEKTEVMTVPWHRVTSTSYFGLDAKACQKGQYINMYSIGRNRTDISIYESFLADLTEFSLQNPKTLNFFVIHRFPTQAVLAVPDDETAYPHRHLKMHIQLESAYVDPTLDDLVDSFLQSARTTFQRNSGFDNLTVYNNFAHGDEGPEVWYTPRKLANLTRLKRQWDPDQLFSWFNPVPLSWP